MKAIDNEAFDISYMHYNDHEYRKSLDDKIHVLMSKFHLNKFVSDLVKECPFEIQIVESPTRHLRQRCRFAVLHAEELVNGTNRLNYAMWEFGGPNITVDSFPIASIQIFNVMPVLLTLIELDVELSNDLRAVNFLSTSIGDIIITLVYERHLESALYLPQIETLRQTLQSMSIYSVGEISVIGRSKGVKLVAGRAWVMEALSLTDGRVLRYKQVDEGFSNPNSSVNARVLDWLCEAAALVNSVSALQGSGLDMLEMYCGNGNHTVALAGCFRRVLAVELNKALCVAAEENFSLNGVLNARVVACDSGRFATQILRNKDSFSSATENVPYEFSAVLVDPPRSGLDPTTCRLVAQYAHILYISCQPDSLIRDLEKLSTTHVLVRIAAFDHFAYTPHLECGVLLRRRDLE